MHATDAIYVNIQPMSVIGLLHCLQELSKKAVISLKA